jgi:HD-GYP domain-containing protein (c-di-GMP phosphodiesterase class II)
MKRANHALYTAKHNGRNRVVVAEDVASVPDRRVQRDTVPSKATHLRIVSGGADTCAEPAPNESVKLVHQLDRQPGGQILSAMLALLDLRDSETEGHSQRVAKFAMRLADEIERTGIAPVTEEVRKELALGALLHDVGKIGVPDAVLKKPASLTDHEWDIMRRHPSQGASLLARFPIMCDALPVVRHHHERWDGTGYPDRLAGDEIPLSARIFAMADTFDAMSSDRIYRRALPYSTICTEFRRVAGTQFDPDLVAAFLAIDEEEWIALRHQSAGGLGDWRLREVSDLRDTA